MQLLKDFKDLKNVENLFINLVYEEYEKLSEFNLNINRSLLENIFKKKLYKTDITPLILFNEENIYVSLKFYKKNNNEAFMLVKDLKNLTGLIKEYLEIRHGPNFYTSKLNSFLLRYNLFDNKEIFEEYLVDNKDNIESKYSILLTINPQINRFMRTLLYEY